MKGLKGETLIKMSVTSTNSARDNIWSHFPLTGQAGLVVVLVERQ